MRKKVERLERRDREDSKKVVKPTITDKVYSKEFQSNNYELDKTDQQEDDWKAIKKHPITRIVVIVGLTMGVIYMSSHVFNLAAKAATSYKKFRKALDS